MIDIPLLKKVASTKKPIIASTGMASFSEIEEAVKTFATEGCFELALLKCTSAYPAPPEEMNLKTICHLAESFNVPVGLSDHTIGSSVAIAAVSLGAVIIEKHLTLSREEGGPDSSFSMEPNEFKAMVQDIRRVEKSFGKVSYALTDKQKESKAFRRSIFVTQNIQAGEIFNRNNLRVIRPGYGLHPRYYERLLGDVATKDIESGTPMDWSFVEAMDSVTN